MSDPSINSAIELHDSTLASVDGENGRIEVSLKPAYLHKSAGVPGVDPGTGWVQDIVLVIEGGGIEGQAPEMPCDLSDGDLIVDERTLANVLTLPLDQSGKIILKLQVMWDGLIVIHGTRIVATLAGEPRYIEDFK